MVNICAAAWTAFRTAREFTDMQRIAAFTLGLLAMFANAAYADKEQLEELDFSDIINMKVTVASRTEERLQDAAGSLVVISRQQIEDMHAHTLGEVLRVFVPGMDVVPTYFNYGDRVEGIYSRGLLADFDQQVLILYNGKNRFNEATGEGPLGAIQFTLENIERVEVSRSPIPLYGANAMTVINLVTREPNFEGVQAGIDSSVDEHGDAPEQKRFSLNWGRHFEKWHLGGSAQYYDDSGQPHSVPAGRGGYLGDADTLRDGTRSAVNVAVNARSQDNAFEAEAWYKATVQDAFLSGLTASPSTPPYEYTGSALAANARYSPVRSEQDKLDLILGVTSTYWRNIANYGGVPVGYDLNDYNLYLEAINQVKFTADGRHSLVTGLKIEREAVTDTVTYQWTGTGFILNRDPGTRVTPLVARQILAAYAEDTWTISKPFSVLAGLRLDAYGGFHGQGLASDASTTLNPRVAVKYAPVEGFTLKGLYASVFRPPGTAEQLGAANFSLSGNPDLKSEQVQTFELSAAVGQGRWRAQLTGFHNLYRNRIGVVTVNGATMYENLALNRVWGADAEVFYYFTPNSYFWVQGTSLRAFDEGSDEDVPFLPQVYVNGGINVRRGKLNLNAVAFFRGQRPLARAADGTDLFPINRGLSGTNFNLSTAVGYEITPQLKAYFSTENVTDTANVVPLGVDGLVVPLHGRTYWLGVSYRPL